MFKRKIYEELIKWKRISNGSTALLIDGARRVGKSYIAEEFAKNEYKSYILVDFGNVPNDVLHLFAQESSDLDLFFAKLSAFYGIKLFKRDSLIVFDEVQQFPRARQLIKYLVADGRYDYLETGSLIRLKKNVQDIIIPSEEEHIEMFPMDFEEFMVANNVSATTLNMLEDKFKTASPVDEFIHKKLLSMFFVYLIVGGMPDAVKAYINTKDIREVDKVQRDITTLYKEDFSQYELEDKKLKVKSIYEIIPAELNKQNKKFVFTMLDKELKFNRYENSFLWLKDAGVALPVYNVDAPVIPLLASKCSNVFRLFSSDIGLLTSAYPAETKVELINKNGEVNNGAHFENAVAQQLVANGFEPYFCKKQKIGEMDFAIEMNGQVVPIEVKSGKAYKSHKALDNFMKVPDYHLEKAYVLSIGNVETDGAITYLPIYMCYLLREQKLEQMIIELDTTGL